MSKTKTNIILKGNVMTQLKKLPDESVNMVMTSPPYWALRDYGTDVECIWDERKDCKHKFSLTKIQAGTQHWNQGGKVIPYKERKIHNEKLMQVGFCSKCGAWKGQIGLEPTFDLYIKHLCDIFDEVKRVLRNDGTCWVNLGDTYSGSGNGTNDYRTKVSKSINSKRFDCNNQIFQGKQKKEYQVLPSKSLCMIPFRFAIEMVGRGWILRNTIIWQKPNCMPSSVKDRFTVDFDYLLFFSKSKKYYFRTQYEPAKTGKSSSFNLRVRDVKKGYSVKSKQYRASEKEVQQYSGQTAKHGQKRIMRTVWSIPVKPFKEAHFAVYPEKLCEVPIQAGCPEGGIVLDPFFGSGTTGLAALKQNKKFIGIELNSQYVRIAEKRLKDRI